MRRFDTATRVISLAKRNKNRFWIEEENYFEGDYSCHHYEIENISWKNFKKKMKKEDEELYLWW